MIEILEKRIEGVNEECFPGNTQALRAISEAIPVLLELRKRQKAMERSKSVLRKLEEEDRCSRCGHINCHHGESK